MLEGRDRESQDRKRSRQGTEERGGRVGHLDQGRQQEVTGQAQSGANLREVVICVTTWEYLSPTDDVMGQIGHETQVGVRVQCGERQDRSATSARYSVDLTCARGEKNLCFRGGHAHQEVNVLEKKDLAS